MKRTGSDEALRRSFCHKSQDVVGSRGKLFLRLAEQALAVGPAPYKSMVKCFAQADNADHNI